ncbi:MAG TPA: dihydrolipoyl dehydrogenase [Actinomycetales bacterium]|nr:dihydrolipoyl dehydrogenase [Actinomycetales bacterium]
MEQWQQLPPPSDTHVRRRFVTESPEYDLVILGGGSGGYAAALRGAQLGLKIALVEADKVGGTCLHRGCIPTKALLHAAELAESVHDAGSMGINLQLSGVDMPKVNEYKDGVIDRLHKGLQGLIKSRKVDYIEGWGTLTGPNTITVDGTEYTGKNVLLASGSYSKTLPGLEIEGRVITSEQALQMDWVPQRAVVLGGGVIGLEFASVWRSLGAEVTVIEGLPHLANNEEEVLSKNLERAFRKRGIQFKTKTMFESVTQDDSGVKVTAGGQVYEGDVLLVAVGRGPATEGLGYEEQGIPMERGFVITNERLHTGVGNIYAAGDIVPGLQLAHRGFQQGIFIAEEIAGLNPVVISDDNIPRVAYCEPELASVGLTEKKAKEKFGEDAVEAIEYNLAGNGKSAILKTAGLIKLVRQKDGPIVGFHAIGARVGELVGEGQLMVNWEAFPEDLAPLVHAHPTQNEAIGEAAMALAGKPLHAHN